MGCHADVIAIRLFLGLYLHVYTDREPRHGRIISGKPNRAEPIAHRQVRTQMGGYLVRSAAAIGGKLLHLDLKEFAVALGLADFAALADKEDGDARVRGTSFLDAAKGQ